MVSRDVQLEKASLPIVVKVEDNRTDLRNVQNWKACSGIDVTCSATVTRTTFLGTSSSPVNMNSMVGRESIKIIAFTLELLDNMLLSS